MSSWSGSTTYQSNRIMFMMDEGSQGGTDINGDGIIGFLLQQYDLDSSSFVDPATPAWAYRAGSGHLAIAVPESDVGDLNGDGDQEDYVLHVQRIDTGATTNLGLAVPFDPIFAQFAGERIVILVSEFRQGQQDLNGDGDALDHVYFVYDMSRNALLNLGVGADYVYGRPHMVAVSPTLVGLLVAERAQGMTDLNGDGDTDDYVVHVHEFSTGITHNVGVASQAWYSDQYWADYIGMQADTSAVAFPVLEWSQQGGSDMNGDGDNYDIFLYVYNVSSQTTLNLGAMKELSTGGQFILRDGIVAFELNETAHGQVDLNGDGDLGDYVLHVHDVETGTTSNLALAVLDWSPWSMRHGRLAFHVSESGQGEDDLNQDGDTSDNVVYVHDLELDETTNLGIAASASPFILRRDKLIMSVREQGIVDLNGDGDLWDRVLHAYSFADASLQNTGLASELAVLSHGVIATLVDEDRQGAVDLNSDGDVQDSVLHLYDLERAEAFNCGLAVETPIRTPWGYTSEDYGLIAGGCIAGVDEASQSTDLNGDGDIQDMVVHLVQLR